MKIPATVAPLWCLLLLAAGDPQQDEPTAPTTFAGRYFQKATALLEAGDQAGAELLLHKVLERDDRHLATWERLGALAEDRGDPDGALYHYQQYLDLVGISTRLRGADKRARADLLERIAELDPQAGALQKAVLSYRKEVRGIARKYSQRKQHVSALRAYLQIQALDPLNADARKNIERIRALPDLSLTEADMSGGADPLAMVEPEWIAAEDARHADWRKADRRKTRHFALRSNAGYEILETAALTLEPLHELLGELMGEELARQDGPLDIWIFRSREDYLANTAGKPDTVGFHDGQKVATYGTGPGRSRHLLFQDLFEFTAQDFVNRLEGAPRWLRRGLVAYAAGSNILTNKQVVHHQPRPLLLREFYHAVQVEQSAPTLDELIGDQVRGYRQTVFGWALVYFLLQHENDGGGPAYREAFLDYVRSFHPADVRSRSRSRRRTKAKAELSPRERFLAVIQPDEKADDAGLLAEVEATWLASISGLGQLVLGDEDFAREQLEQARQLAAEGQHARAARTVQTILTALPGWADALPLAAELHAELDQQDRAVNLHRDFLAATAGDAEAWPQERAASSAALAKLDPQHERWLAASTQFRTDVDAVVAGYLGAEMPRMAMVALECLRAAPPLRSGADQQLHALEDQTGLTIRRWRLLFNERDLDGWYGGTAGHNYTVLGDRLQGQVGQADREEEGVAPNQFVYRILFVDREVSGDYTFEAEALSLRDPVSGKHCRLVGLAFGAQDSDHFWALNFLPFGTLDFGSYANGWQTDRQLTRLYEPEEWLRLRIDVRGDRVTAYLDDEQMFESTLPVGVARGNFGILTGDGLAHFRNLRIRARW